MKLFIHQEEQTFCLRANKYKHKFIIKLMMTAEEKEHKTFDYDEVKSWLETRCHTTITKKSSPTDFAIMQEMLSKHPNFEDWKCKECDAFKITRSAKGKALQVHMKMIKPEVEPLSSEKPKFGDMNSLKKKKDNWRIVSWVACATGKVVRKPKDSNKITQAMRYAVRKQISGWRNHNAYNPKCMLCQTQEKLEVDHYPLTFAKMKTDFIATYLDGKIEDVKVRWDNRNTSYRFSKGEPINTRWQRFHQARATYRWLCGNCNKKMNSKQVK